MAKWILIITFVIFSIEINAKENVVSPITTQIDNINIKVDPRIEALAVIQYLDDYFLISQYEFEYKRLVDSYFSSYKNHKAVALFSELKNSGYKFSLPPETMLYLNYDFTINQELDLFDSNLPKDFKIEKLLEFFRELNYFVKDSNFINFFNSNKKLYEELITQVARELEGQSDLGLLEQFYGKTNESYNIVLAPLFHHGGFGPQTKGENSYNLFSIIGPVGSKASRPSFGDVERLAELVNHEFSHSFIADIFKEYGKEVREYHELLIPIKDVMAKQGYSTWEFVLNEHVVRAVTTTVSYTKSKQLGDENLKYQKDNHFIYIDLVLESFERYKSERDKYPTFDSYFPVLLGSLPEP